MTMRSLLDYFSDTLRPIVEAEAAGVGVNAANANNKKKSVLCLCSAIGAKEED